MRCRVGLLGEVDNKEIQGEVEQCKKRIKQLCHHGDEATWLKATCNILKFHTKRQSINLRGLKLLRSFWDKNLVI